MTTGNKTFGTSVAVSTDSGPGTVKTGYGTRSWSGSDYPKTKPTYTIINTSHWVERIKVRKGKVYVVMKYKPRFVRIRDRPPKRARIEEHAYDMTHQIDNDTIFSYRNPPQAYRTGTGQNTGIFNPSFTTGWTGNNDIALFGKLREAVAGSDFNAGVFLGEGHQALDMIGNAARRIAGSLRALKKGNFPRALEMLTKGTPRYEPKRKVTANNWLEMQYGWLPLLKDAENGAKFLAHQMSVPLQHVVRVSGSANGVATNLWMPYGQIASGRVYTRKSIKAILREKDVIALSGLTDPLSVAWELVPYSFVVDWFIPIGNYLSARGLAQSLSGTFVTSTKFYRKASGVTIQPGYTASWVLDGRQKGCSREIITFSRTVSSSLAVPRPSVKPLSEVVSWKRAANAIALLMQHRS